MFLRKLKRIYRGVLASIYSLIYNNPQKSFKIIGVTGTSGKSTTSLMIYQFLNANNIKAGLISTVEAYAGEEVIDTGLHVTTPDSRDLYKIFKKMKEQNVEYVVLETSSHALDQNRFGKLEFEYAVFTNIKNDHLDWHKTWENYALSKAILLKLLKKSGVAVLNKDDSKTYTFLQTYIRNNNLDIKVIPYSKKHEAKNIKLDAGIEFNYLKESFKFNITGEFNIENILASLKVLVDLNVSLKDLSNSSKNISLPKGRLEVVKKSPFKVIVDFAHNADSLKVSLESLKKIKGKGRLIVVFGSAGLRDVKKRFDMGEIASQLADIIIVTSEDPRTESLSDINSEILRGASKFKLIKRFKDHIDFLNFEFKNLNIKNNSIFTFDEESVNSRYDAIKFAIDIAKPDDIIVTQGKGHEKSLAFGNTEYPFSDFDAIERALN